MSSRGSAPPLEQGRRSERPCLRVQRPDRRAWWEFAVRALPTLLVSLDLDMLLLALPRMAADVLATNVSRASGNSMVRREKVLPPGTADLRVPARLVDLRVCRYPTVM